VTLAAWLRKES